MVEQEASFKIWQPKGGGGGGGGGLLERKQEWGGGRLNRAFVVHVCG